MPKDSTHLQNLIAEPKGPETPTGGQGARPTLITTIDRIVSEDMARAQADIKALRQQTGGRGPRWTSYIKAAALIQQARWPAEAWIGKEMLGELARGEIPLRTFRKRSYNVMTSEVRLARMRTKAIRNQQAKEDTRRRRTKTTEKKADRPDMRRKHQARPDYSRTPRMDAIETLVRTEPGLRVSKLMLRMWGERCGGTRYKSLHRALRRGRVRLVGDRLYPGKHKR